MEPVGTLSGWTLFNQQEDQRRRYIKVSSLAKAKGVDLPKGIKHLPDETLKFLGKCGISPDFVNRSQEDSLVIEFTAQGVYHLVEFLKTVI